MTRPFEVATGKWWRFSEYEIFEGRFVRPAHGAKLELYEPWEDYRTARARKQPTPYESALELSAHLRFSRADRKKGQESGAEYVLVPESEAKLLGWCAEHGLLGVLLQQTRLVALAPTKEKSKQELGRTTYHRTSTGWLADHATPEEDWLRPHVVLQPWRGSEGPEPILTIEGLSHTWSRFFPDVPENQKETYDYPHPTSPEFWEVYAEPVDLFVDALRSLRAAISKFRGDELKKGITEDTWRFHLALDPLNQLVGSTHPVLEPQGSSVRQKWYSPSLLSMFAMMALLDLDGGGRILRCVVCDKLFFSDAWQAKYCSSRCRNTAQKRAHRKKKGAEEKGASKSGSSQTRKRRTARKARSRH